MKNLFVILLFPILALSQEKTISILHSPGSLQDGYSFGFQFEYSNDLFYISPEVYIFPDLNDLDYAHLVIRAGFKLPIDATNRMKLYSGVRGGAIKRQGYSLKPLIGWETGVNWYLNDWFFIGGAGIVEMKADSKIWSRESYHNVISGIIKIGVVL